MTDFMTALHLMLVQLTCPADQRVKGVQFHLTCNLYRDGHKTQVWLCFLLLGFLCRSIGATSGDEISQLQRCLKLLTQKNISSDVMLYAPSVDEIKNNCEWASLRCYMLEMKMVLKEEGIVDTCISHFLHENERMRAHSDGCPVCETYSLQNITIFLERLKTLLEKMNAQRHM